MKSPIMIVECIMITHTKYWYVRITLQHSKSIDQIMIISLDHANQLAKRNSNTTVSASPTMQLMEMLVSYMLTNRLIQLSKLALNSKINILHIVK